MIVDRRKFITKWSLYGKSSFHFSGEFTFAICCRPSVCRLSVTLVRLLSRLKFSAMFLRHFVPWLSVDIYGKFDGDRPRRTPPTPSPLRRRGSVKCNRGRPSQIGSTENARHATTAQSKICGGGNCEKGNNDTKMPPTRPFEKVWKMVRWPRPLPRTIGPIPRKKTRTHPEMRLANVNFYTVRPPPEITQNNAITPSRSFKVTDFGTNRKLIYDCLLVINSNLPPILHRFRDSPIAVDRSEIAILGYTPLVFNSPVGGVPLGRSPWNFQWMSMDSQGT